MKPQRKRPETRVNPTFLDIGRRWSSAMPQSRPEQAMPPRQAIDMALEQIRAFIERDDSSRVLHDGTVSHITNADEVVGIIEGFLDYLANSSDDAHLTSLAAQLAAARREFPEAKARLNAYIRMLCELRDQLPSEQEARLAHLAEASLSEMVETALGSPYITLLPDGTLAGDPGARIERALLEEARGGLEELLEAGALTEELMMTETLLERVNNLLRLPPGSGWLPYTDPAGSRMGLINQVIAHWHGIRSHHTVA